jgi:hypothetical protein
VTEAALTPPRWDLTLPKLRRRRKRRPDWRIRVLLLLAALHAVELVLVIGTGDYLAMAVVAIKVGLLVEAARALGRGRELWSLRLMQMFLAVNVATLILLPAS